MVEELVQVRIELKKDDSDESYSAIGEITNAKIQAEKGNGVKVFEHLKNAGNVALRAAEAIGAGMVVEFIKKALDM